MTVLFTNGVALRRAPVPRRRRRCWSRRGRIRAVGTRTRARPTRWSTSQGGLLAPGFVDAHVHAGAGRPRAHPLRPHRAATTRDDYLADHPGVRRRAPGPALDPRRRLGDVGLPRRHADRGRPGRGRARPSGVPAQPRPPRRLGQHPRARAGRHRPAHPRPGRRPLRARRRRQPDRHPARGRDARGRRARAADHRRRVLRRAPRGPALPPLVRRDRLAGRDRRRVRRHGRPRPDVPARRPRAATSRPTSSARCGGTASRGAEQIADLRRRAATPTPTGGSARPASR